jgi:hypothetical protein
LQRTNREHIEIGSMCGSWQIQEDGLRAVQNAGIASVPQHIRCDSATANRLYRLQGLRGRKAGTP